MPSTNIPRPPLSRSCCGKAFANKISLSKQLEEPIAGKRPHETSLPWRVCFCGCVVLDDRSLESVSQWVRHCANCGNVAATKSETYALAGLLAVADTLPPWEHLHDAKVPVSKKPFLPPLSLVCKETMAPIAKVPSTTSAHGPMRRTHPGPLTRKQRDQLQKTFEQYTYPSTEIRTALAQRIGLSLRQVTTWMQNARRRTGLTGTLRNKEQTNVNE